MQQIINFLIRNKTFLLYFLLLVISLALTVQTHSYHQSKFLNSANAISGALFEATDNFSSYFGLREENERLAAENLKLRTRLFNLSKSLPPIGVDSTLLQYGLVRGRVINNNYAAARNYITINKGEKDSLRQDMGVITDLGILGIVENTSANYATVQSILNEKSNINAKIKNSNHFGSLVWNTQDYRTAQLVDIPRLVPLTIGDTIVTGAMSSIFPENIPIGTISKFDLDSSNSFYAIDVLLFNDMSNLGHIYVIKNYNRSEILELQRKTEEDGQ
ncbi:rod shape-determining protein MreC [Maribacter sp. 2307ULW6-5]|uniref:rod shape-determining protein MreC n=1 Tax=Maribacter sp. 2307ULW6-5 TaxID=3386275 RepID=UPI0039BCF011